MVSRTNRKVLDLLGGDPQFYEPNSEPVPDSLVVKLSEGFKEVDGCVVPSSFQAQSIWSELRPRKDNVYDETGFECTLHRVNVEDLVDAGMALSELARIGVAYAIYLRKALIDSPVSGNFRIIVDVQIPDVGFQVANVCSVRFHKVRPNQVWPANDLESYNENAVFVFDFEKTTSQDS